MKDKDVWKLHLRLTRKFEMSVISTRSKLTAESMLANATELVRSGSCKPRNKCELRISRTVEPRQVRATYQIVSADSAVYDNLL